MTLSKYMVKNNLLFLTSQFICWADPLIWAELGPSQVGSLLSLWSAKGWAGAGWSRMDLFAWQWHEIMEAWKVCWGLWPELEHDLFDLTLLVETSSNSRGEKNRSCLLVGGATNSPWMHEGENWGHICIHVPQKTWVGSALMVNILELGGRVI